MNRRLTFVSFSLIAIGCALSSVISPVLAADGDSPSRVVKALYEGGVRKCIYQLDLLVKLAHEDDSAYAFVNTYGEPRDLAGYTTITVENLGQGTVIRTFAVAPDQSEGCSISTTLVMSSQSNCGVTRDKIFDDWTFYGEAGNAAAYERESEKESTLILSPTENNGCSIIKSSNQSFIGDEEIKRRSIKKDRKKS